MPDYCAQYGPSAWVLTRELIGQELKTLYEVPTELPPRLLTLAHQLGTTDATRPANELPAALRALIRKLDTLEGDRLLRRCNQRVRDLPQMNFDVLT